jgi:hypothetical protein
MPDTNLVFDADEQIVTLTVQVTSNDFDIGQDALPLKLPRAGRRRERRGSTSRPSTRGAAR